MLLRVWASRSLPALDLSLPVLVTLVSLTCVPAWALAEDTSNAESSDNEPRGIERIEVTGENYLATRVTSSTKTDRPLLETAQSISVINRDQLDDRNVGTLAEALRYTPGVRAEPFGLEPRFTFLRIRGLDATTTGLFRDGLQLRNPSFVVSSLVEPYGVESIEVPRGPAGALYGQSSAGGLVNFISKRPSADSVREMELELGNHHRVEGKFDLGGSIGSSETLTYRLTGLSRKSDTQVDNLEDDRIFLAPALTWQPNDRTSITFLTTLQRDETRNSQALPAPGTIAPNPFGDVPISRFTGEPDVDHVDRKERTASYILDYQLSDSVSLHQTFRYNHIELDDIVVFSNGISPDLRTIQRGVFASFGELRSFTVDSRARIDGQLLGVGHELLVGVDYQRFDFETVQSFGDAPSIDIFEPVYGAPTTIPAPFQDDEARQRQLGLYAQDQITVADRWILTLGARYDWSDSETRQRLANAKVDQDDDEFSGRVALAYRTDFGLVPYVSYAESFLPIAQTSSSGPDFEPETGRQYEVGLKYQPPALNALFTFALFDLERENFLERDPATMRQRQTGKRTSKGVELEVIASLPTGVNLVASYTYADVEENGGIVPNQTPRKYGSARLEYAFRSGFLDGFSFAFGARYNGPTFGDPQKVIKVPSYAVADASIQYDWGRVRLGLDVQNLFDKEYAASCFERDGANFCTFGETRTVRFTTKYSW